METMQKIEETKLLPLVEKVRKIIVPKIIEHSNENLDDYIESMLDDNGINNVLKKIHGTYDEYYEYDKKKIIRDFYCDIIAEELGIKDKDDIIFYLNQFTFEYTEEKVLDLIRIEKNWRKANIDRNINIFRMRQKGKLYDVIGKEFNLSVSSISEIVKDVKGAIRHYKGKMLEKQYSKFLVKSNLFNKVEWLGGSGEPDIVAHDLKNNVLYVFSIKNLAIKKYPYYIPNDLIKAEYKYAYDSQFSYKEVHLILVVFNNTDNSTIHLELDYNQPKDIILKE